jgi:hypothetical protein
LTGQRVARILALTMTSITSRVLSLGLLLLALPGLPGASAK